MDDDRSTELMSRLLRDFVRHESAEVVVPPFSPGRRVSRPQHRPGSGGRRLVVVALAMAVVAGTVIVTVLYGPRSSDTGIADGGSLTATTWRVAATPPWVRQFAPANISNFGAPDTVTCPAESVSTCYTTVNAVSVYPSILTSAAYRTTDSGSTWGKLTLPAKTWLSSKFSCFSSSTCAVGADVQVASASTPDFTGRAAMLSTDDGGRRWVTRDLPSAYGLVTDLSCPTPSHCVAFAWLRGSDPLPNFQSGYDRYYPTTVLVTNDGGRNWMRSSLPRTSSPLTRFELASNNGGSLSCPSTTMCDAMGEEAELVTFGGGYVEQDERLVVLVSHNGGRSWSVTQAQDGWGGGTISCPSASHCWMLENVGTAPSQGDAVFTSADGGGRWSSVESTELPQPDNADLESFTCPSVHDCAVADNSANPMVQTILVTQDGGRHWRSQALPLPDISKTVTGLSCDASGSCLALDDVALSSPFEIANEILRNKGVFTRH
jgi:photosystem II stability/assembly factor-like uncharacterized protein